MSIFVGLFNVNRPLNQHELDNRLEQKKYNNVDPRTQLCTIRLNSTFLECVDFFYTWRGLAAFLGLSSIILFLWGVLSITIFSISQWHTYNSDDKLSTLIFGSLIWLISLSVIIISFYLLRFDAFRLTHYPIRFNRKNRMVYAFRRDGSVFSVKWDDLYIVHNNIPGPAGWHIRGHVLKEDGLTVLDSFGIPNPSASYEGALEQWEFIRRYMEDGPKEAYDAANYFMPLWDRKESVKFSFLRLMGNFSGHPIGQFLLSPIILAFTIGRVFAMFTNKIPQWPEDVEAACPVEPNDPYVKDWRSNPTSVDFS